MGHASVSLAALPLRLTWAPGSACILVGVSVAGPEENHNLLVQVLGCWTIRSRVAFQLMGSNSCATNAFKTLMTGEKV